MLRYLLFVLSIFIIGCGGGSTDSDYDYKPFLHQLFLTQYFWSDKVAKKVDYSQYPTPQSMIDGLKYEDKDAWSMVMTKEENSDFLNQKAGGFGFGHIADEHNESRMISFVRLDSPAFKAGFKRGDILESINGEKATLQTIQNASGNLGKETTIGIYRPSMDTHLDIPITSQEYSFKVTQTTMVTSTQKEQVGYMRFDSFTATATKEIDEAFDFFKEQNTTQLVIDMRYNGGGSVVTASILLDKLLREQDEQIQFVLAWNEAYEQKNQAGRFETDDNSLNLQTIIFLTTKSTASASELVINALKPYLGDSVVTIGSTTHGKPVGMEGKTDGTYIYYLVNFVIKNADGFFDYFEGLEVTGGCEAEDDFAHEQGDADEAMLKTALYYIDNGSCL